MPNRIGFALVCFLCVGVTATPANAGYFDTATLVNHCDKHPDQATAYILGVADRLAWDQEVERDGDQFRVCLPPGLVAGELLAFVCSELRESDRQTFPAAGTIGFALRKKWLCEQ